MRIALFSDAVPPRLDGVAMTLGRVVAELAYRGHAVAVVGPGPFDDLPGASVQIRLPSIPLPTLPGLHAAMPYLRAADARRLDAFDADIVHAFTEMPVGVSGRAYARKRRIPFVTSAHTDYVGYAEHWGLPRLAAGLHALVRWFHRPASVTLCPSASYARVLLRRGHVGTLRPWGRGVDTTWFAPCRRSVELRRRFADRGERIVITVGRIVPEKRIDRLVDAFVAADVRDTVLLVVGEGSSRRRLERSAPSCVRFTGALRGGALAEAYASSDLFATASVTETFGNAVLEAMASGLPPIVPRQGALAELVDEGFGTFFDDERELAYTLRHLLVDDGLRSVRSSAARAAAMTRTWSRAIDELLDGYRFGMGGKAA
jgi:glycosyltransferase involved in cell wall biosynthesis